MSSGCNFINWMAATRIAKGPTTTSADNLTQPTGEGKSSLMRTSSSNQLPGSSETICGDQSQPTALTSAQGNHLQPLEIGIDPPLMVAADGDDISSVFTNTESDIISTEDLLQIEMENLRLDKEIQDLEKEALYWEQKVEELERQQFKEDVPRTVVENIIKHRKELRELELQLYEISLTNPSIVHVNDFNEAFSYKSANKLASHLRPGQENTADILDAVPPSGSLQYRQYLSKASSGTDSSEYSQLPSYKLHHSHRVDVLESPTSLHRLTAGDDFCNDRGHQQAPMPQPPPPPPPQQQQQQQPQQHRLHKQSRRQHNQAGHTQQRIYSQLDNNQECCRSVSRLQRLSPVRPNHFKGDFVPPRVHDSSSTPSSGSTQ